MVLYPPSFQLDLMPRPGAMMSTSAPKLEKSAMMSSWSRRHVAFAPPRAAPLKSANAETVMTSSYAAGMNVLASFLLFPAATT